MSGTAAATKISASAQLVKNMMVTPMTTVSEVTTSMMSPNAIQRRIRLRSLMDRDSNWPLPQRSWNPTVRFCRCR